MTPSANFIAESNRQQDSVPLVKVEFIDPSGNATDISAYYSSGANFNFKKNLVPDQIQAGNFDVVLFNHDNTFSEFDPTSLLYSLNYHAAKIRISLGFVLTNGSIEYATQAIGRVDQITVNNDSTVTFRCRDFIQRIIDTILRQRPSSESPVPDSANTGNGTCSIPATQPFTTVTENITVTCTVGGTDGAALFSVVGSVSGSLGIATSGTRFASGGVAITINAGSIDFAVGDKFTFTVNQAPEYNYVNPAKIIWSVLTGYDWDSDTQESFASFVLTYDHTQSNANADIDYNSFVDAVAALDVIVGGIKGFCPYETNAAEFLNGILLSFMGSLYTAGDGRIKLKAFAPTFGGAVVSASFSDIKKITAVGYLRTVDETINSVTCTFRISDTWVYSDESDDLAASYLIEDAASIALYGRLSFSIESPWYQPNGAFLRGVAQRMIQRYAVPPTTIEFTTGLDAVSTEIADYVDVTDTKYNLAAFVCEVVEVKKQFDEMPKKIGIRARRETGWDTQWGFLASEVSEGDGISPQSDNWDTASVSDKQFIYLSQTGGGGPDYRMF